MTKKMSKPKKVDDTKQETKKDIPKKYYYPPSAKKGSAHIGTSGGNS